MGRSLRQAGRRRVGVCHGLHALPGNTSGRTGSQAVHHGWVNAGQAPQQDMSPSTSLSGRRVSKRQQRSRCLHLPGKFICVRGTGKGMGITSGRCTGRGVAWVKTCGRVEGTCHCLHALPLVLHEDRPIRRQADSGR